MGIGRISRLNFRSQLPLSCFFGVRNSSSLASACHAAEQRQRLPGPTVHRIRLLRLMAREEAPANRMQPISRYGRSNMDGSDHCPESHNSSILIPAVGLFTRHFTCTNENSDWAQETSTHGATCASQNTGGRNTGFGPR